MKKRNVFATVFMVTLFLVVLTACGSNSSEPTNNTEQSSADKKTELRFAWWGGEDRHTATLEAIEKYMELNPNVTIKPEYSGFDGYGQKLSTQLAGGTTPDIIQMDYYYMAEIAQKGDQFVDFYEHEDLIDLSTFDENFIKDFSEVDNKLVGLPTGVNSIILFVNQRMLDEYGIQLEDKYNWDKLIEEGKKVNQENPDQYFLNMSAANIGQFMQYYIQQETGKNFIEDDYSLGFDKAVLVDAFTYMNRLWDEGVVPDVSDYATLKENLEQTPKWLSGDLGTILMSASAIDRFKNSNVDLIPLLPPMNENAVDTGIRTQPSQVLSVSKNSSEPEEAIKFLDWFLNDEEAITILGSSRGSQPTEKGRQILAETDQLDPLIAESINLGIEHAGLPINAISLNSEVGKIYDDIVEKVGYDLLTPEEAAEQLINELSEFLDDIES